MIRVLALFLLSAVPVSAQDCGPARDAAYRQGFAEGVEAVNAQLGAVTARMQRDVQAQVNAQLARLESERARELDSRLAAAQAGALAQQGPISAAGMPSMRMATVAPRRDSAAHADAAALPAGTTITITDPQNLPPELFRALMDYAVQ